MSATHVLCPNGKTNTIKQCLEQCPYSKEHPSGRCMSLPTLTSVLQERPWSGTPSTTQLLRGTREAFLAITQPYTIDPQQAVFAMYGTSVHAKLETVEVPDALKEERLYDEYSSGAFDYYDKATNSLWDFKTYGSFKASKILGINKSRIPIGKFKNGNTKFKTFFTEDGHKDRFELSVQLNDYRTKLERIGYKVANMFCEILCRDGNTMVAKNRGIFKNTYIVRLNKISDRWIEKWKRVKSQALQKALETGLLPPPCKPRERWTYFDERKGRLVNNKCAKYCNVWKYCDIGRLEHEEDLEDE